MSSQDKITAKKVGFPWYYSRFYEKVEIFEGKG
jgi:hypothetical protein